VDTAWILDLAGNTFKTPVFIGFQPAIILALRSNVGTPQTASF
jgi:hypothetical protein